MSAFRASLLLVAALLLWQGWEERKKRYAEVARRQDRSRMYGITEIDGRGRAPAQQDGSGSFPELAAAPPAVEPIRLPAPLDDEL